MKIQVWSDIVCPFCYIGKRNYEAALKQFPYADNIEIEWRSFQLNPNVNPQNEKGKDQYQYLADQKGISYEQSLQMHQNVTEIAKRAGLTYNFDRAVILNSFDAHRIMQFAKTRGLSDKAQERLSHAYFTEGKDLNDHATLIELGKEIGLSAQEVKEALSNEVYAQKVKDDIQAAQQMGIGGVPFFVLNGKFAVSGAQPPEAFLQALNSAYEDFQKDSSNLTFKASEGEVCRTDGDCI